MSTELAIRDDQEAFNEKQLAVLTQLGVQGATRADQALFFHQCVRTGLDPFARQIYMIGRQGKWTIQTGIDGFRLVARRAVDRAGETLAYAPPQWCGEDGEWRDVWLLNTPPIAAKFTVFRNGEPFTNVAKYSEYVQTTRDGSPNSMWARMPSNQLRKCAEAGALRMAFPQELSGLYTDDELRDDKPAQAARVTIADLAPTPDPHSYGGDIRAHDATGAMLGPDDQADALPLGVDQ